MQSSILTYSGLSIVAWTAEYLMLGPTLIVARDLTGQDIFSMATGTKGHSRVAEGTHLQLFYRSTISLPQTRYPTVEPSDNDENG